MDNLKIVAEVRQGKLISLAETQTVEEALGEKLNWEEVRDSRETAGNYFQCLYQINLSASKARIAKQAIAQYREEFSV